MLHATLTHLKKKAIGFETFYKQFLSPPKKERKKEKKK